MSTGKRALFLFPTDRMGGAERVTRTLVESALRTERFSEIVCFVLSRTRSGTLDDLAKSPGITLVYSMAPDELRGLPHLLRILTKGRYDFVFASHTHLSATASLMRRLGLLKTVRLVTRESTLIFERDLGWRGPVARQLYRLYGGQDLIVCQTTRMAESLTRNTRNRFAAYTETIPNPIDTERIATAREQPTEVLADIPDGRRRIVWCGRISPVKSPLRAIDTLARLHQLGRKDAHLVLIGDGPMREAVLIHAKSLGLNSYITLLGHHPGPAAVMQHCHVGLLTSDIEGFPNVILEMLASGVRAVVSTNCAGDLNHIPGVVVSQLNTPDELARSLLQVLDIEEQHKDVQRSLAERSPDAFFMRLINPCPLSGNPR